MSTLTSQTIWQTPTAERAERSYHHGLDTLATLQDSIDDYARDRASVPDSLIAEYQSTARAVLAFGDEWGFDTSDVEDALMTMH